MEQIDPRIVILAAGSAYFVQIGVDLIKGALGSNPHNHWVLPLTGILFAWAIVSATQVYANVPLTPATWAGSFLAAILAYQMAAGASALHKTVRSPGRRSRTDDDQQQPEVSRG